MQRRLKYALTAGVLSSGAPAGLLGIRLAKTPAESVSLQQVRSELAADRAAYLYVGAATALIFALFGYVLGRHADELAEMSETDSLTGLLNARGFYTRVRGEIKRLRRYRQPLSLLFLDLDELKSINDRHGHRAGSAAIRETGHLIQWELRETDLAARWGGDEFTILAPNTPQEAALALAERIRRRVAEPTAPRSPWRMTVSIGVATFNADVVGASTDPATLVGAADAAMYDAKKRGKNTVAAAPILATVNSPSER
jgi:diguanylate cyclase (GGDEF)-like protein